MSVMTYNGRTGAHADDDPDDLPHVKAGRHRYNIARALAMVARDSRRSGLEAETSQELTKRFGRHPNGLWIPHDAPLPRAERYDLTSTTGGGAIRTVMPDTLFDALRNRLICARLGAQVGDFAGGVNGKVALPVKRAASAAAWVREGAAPAASSPVRVEQAQGEPHDVTVFTDTSRLMLSEGQPDFRRFVVEDLAGGIASAVDKAALNGAGNNGEPLGLAQWPWPSFSFTSGTPTRAGLSAMKRIAGQANVDAAADSRMGFVTSNAGREALELTDNGGATPTGLYLWESRVCRNEVTNELETIESVLGQPAAASESIPSGLSGAGLSNATSLLYGNWRHVVIQLFGAIDVMTNPYSFDASGSVRFRAWQAVDVLLLHPTVSFVQAVIVAPNP